MGVRLVINQVEISVLEIENRFDTWVDFHSWQWIRFASQLQLGLFDMVIVQVEIAECVHEFSNFEIANLSDHVGK